MHKKRDGLTRFLPPAQPRYPLSAAGLFIAN